MGVGGSTSKPLASLFGADEEGGLQAKRGPTLGSVLLPGVEANAWRLTLAAPLRIQVFDARTAKPVALEDTSAASAIQDHAPFTAFCASEEPDPTSSGSGGEAKWQPRLVVGCQDGTILVFALSKGTVSGPLYELRAAADQDGGGDSPRASEGSALAMSITALHLMGRDELYAGSCSRCYCWNLTTGELQREFHLPGVSGHPATPSTLAAVRRSNETGGQASSTEAAQLWVGLDNGNIAVFDVQTGVLTRSFICVGPEAVMSLAYFPNDRIVFALSAHRRVSVWDASSYACLQKYQADLMTCGADLSAMVAIDYKAMEMSLLVLAGVDGSLCVRRVSRRGDGKLHCVLLCYMESVSGDVGCPITSIGYHAPTDSVLLGDAGCTVALIGRLKEHLGHAASLPGTGISSSAPVSREATSTSLEGAGGAAASASAPAAPAAGGVVAPAAASATEAPVAPASEAAGPEAPPADVQPPKDDSPFPVFQGSS